MTTSSNSTRSSAPAGALPSAVFWRVEGSLLELGALRPVGYLTWNAQSFSERWARRAGMLFMGLTRPAAYASHRVFATRLLHTLLRGISRDRLDLLGEEYFDYVLKPQLKRGSVEKLQEALAAGEPIVLVSQGLEHVMAPLARHLGVGRLIANRLEFRGGRATGRLLEPVIRPRGPLAWLSSGDADGRISRKKLAWQLGFSKDSEPLDRAMQSSGRPAPVRGRTVVMFDGMRRLTRLSVRQSLAGKHILLVGVTGFIGKVWLANLLGDLPEIGKITLLVRRNRTTSARRRFEKIVEESPAFDALHRLHGSGLAAFLRERTEVVEGDVSQPGLGLEVAARQRLAHSLDLVVNSSGLTDFNPDLRDALNSNVYAPLRLLEFLRECDHAGLVHLSTCYVVGARDGRVMEELQENYTPAREPGFDAEKELVSLQELIRRVEQRSESVELTAALRRQALGRGGRLEGANSAELENVLRRNRARWVRNRLTLAGKRRARHLGWPNTYTFTKSLAESLLTQRGAGLPIAVVRPSIVETSTSQPFPGWNEGVNTSAPLSYLLGTNFRQLPTNARKCLDVIPVDLVCRGMTLIAAAVIERRHARLYQLATSGVNPVDMGRSIELTGLAHRKHYRAQQGLEHWLRTKLETIPVSKNRYERLSVPMQKAVISGINRFAVALRLKKAPLARQERDLDRVGKLIELYEPFILLNEQVFESLHVQLLSAALPAEEQAEFGYDAEAIDWWDYWINVHIPALRKWCYPLIEGKSLEARPRREINWNTAASAAQTGEGGVDFSAAPPSKALWPSS
ncbi:MAG TPA: SDR family oxidoreductase [Candidatus Acidoferrales bacterium]|nr:SDR family oxidoreductase [Candidatus Acidoferrales bacterium]